MEAVGQTALLGLRLFEVVQVNPLDLDPEEGRGQYRVELRGDLAAFMHLPDDGTDSGRKKAKARAVGGTGLLCSGSTDSLVAGARGQLDLLLSG